MRLKYGRSDLVISPEERKNLCIYMYRFSFRLIVENDLQFADR